MTTILEARTEVQREMQQLLALVDRQSQQTATDVEISLWSGVLRLGMSLMALFFAHQAAKWPTGLRYEVSGVSHVVQGADVIEIGTKFGKVSVLQPMGREVGRPRSRRDLPMSRELELPGGFTLPLVTLVAKFCALMAFSPTRQILRDLLGWAPAPRSVLRMVDTVGGEVRGFLEQAAVPDGDTDVLLITVDGKGAPAISSAEDAKRRQPHRKGTGGLRQRKSGAPKKRLIAIQGAGAHRFKTTNHGGQPAIFLVEGEDPDGPIINGPDLAHNGINLPINAGTHTYT